MKVLLGIALVCSGFAATLSAAEKKTTPNPHEVEKMTRLQIFLDSANFGPGKIDGRGGEFTQKALALYRSSQGAPAPVGEAPVEHDTKAKGSHSRESKLPDTTGIDLDSVGEPYTKYTVTAEDLQNVGDVPTGPAAMAKLKAVPYRSVLEEVAERYHSDIDFIKSLNPELKSGVLKEGDTVVVPNVKAFELGAVKQIKPGEAVADSASDSNKPDEKAGNAKADDSVSAPGKSVSVHISTKDKMLQVREGDKVIAAFPVTPGSTDIPSPIGHWKVQGVAKMPEFRHDEKMLKEGVRSANAHMIPPGPNNPVGVVWIALNKKGIGIHGTDDPDSIGRAASHGCIRLANWDVAKLATMVKAGVAVEIE